MTTEHEPKAAEGVREMKEYRKTATIRAEQFLPNQGKIPAGVISDGCGDPRKEPTRYAFIIRTLENNCHYVSDGDWIATGIQGEQWAIKPDVFVATYEEVSESPKASAEQVPRTFASICAEFDAYKRDCHARGVGDKDRDCWLIEKLVAEQAPVDTGTEPEVSEMTSKERVLQVWPEAYAVYHAGQWAIYDSPGPRENLTEWFTSQETAWDAAAGPLPKPSAGQAPPAIDWTICPNCSTGFSPAWNKVAEQAPVDTGTEPEVSDEAAFHIRTLRSGIDVALDYLQSGLSDLAEKELQRILAGGLLPYSAPPAPQSDPKVEEIRKRLQMMRESDFIPSVRALAECCLFLLSKLDTMSKEGR